MTISNVRLNFLIVLSITIINFQANHPTVRADSSTSASTTPASCPVTYLSDMEFTPTTTPSDSENTSTDTEKTPEPDSTTPASCPVTYPSDMEFTPSNTTLDSGNETNSTDTVLTASKLNGSNANITTITPIPYMTPPPRLSHKNLKFGEFLIKPVRPKWYGIGQRANFSHLDVRVGEIVNIAIHPSADLLYILTANVNKTKNITIVTGIRRFIPPEDLFGKLGVFLVNVFPINLRGFSSEGVLMCARRRNKMESLSPPPNSIPGDQITVEGFKTNPVDAVNVRDRFYQEITRDFYVTHEHIATYRQIPWNIEGKGLVKTNKLHNVKIR